MRRNISLEYCRIKVWRKYAVDDSFIVRGFHQLT